MSNELPSRSDARNVLTLVADDLGDRQLRRAAAVLAERGAEAGAPEWLAAGEACDLPFDGLDAQEAENVVRAGLTAADEAPVDIAAQPVVGRRKKLLITDMDSTVVRNEMLDEVADFAGFRAAVAAITERAMRGEIPFRDALYERVALLAGRSSDMLARAYDERLELSPGAADLVATLRGHGVFTALVSGGFTFFTERLKERLGFDFEAANRFEIRDGKLTGRVVEPLRGRAAKRETLELLCAELGITLDDAIALGDGANDLAMIEAAGCGVAYRAKPSVAKAARFRIEREDLTTLLFFQGYRRDEFQPPD